MDDDMEFIADALSFRLRRLPIRERGDLLMNEMNFYDEEELENEKDDDLISPEEQAFMLGYLRADVL
ncbi:MAG TPA: hypothetical protein VJC07_01125 [Candidatus Nanoarchaeia archaeon]|nr:hypothetical protein [Candidatus Nanoarchaeia archaeon]